MAPPLMPGTTFAMPISRPPKKDRAASAGGQDGVGAPLLVLGASLGEEVAMGGGIGRAGGWELGGIGPEKGSEFG